MTDGEKEVFFVKAGLTTGMFAILAGVTGWMVMEIGMMALVVSIPLSVLLIVLSGFMWQWGNTEGRVNRIEQTEKMKRDQIDRVLRTLTDEQLHALQQRLQDDDIDEQIEYALGSDGELIQRKR